MKFLVDAQLPRKLAHFLVEHGFDAIHTLDLPLQNNTPDTEIIDIADQTNRAIITKDSDFLHNFIINNKPRKLIIVSTGNLRNQDLLTLFSQNIDTLLALLGENQVIEINTNEVTVLF
ncbi:MAG: DUF5615 family PIN-like protein [Balneolales bacterium]|nr:DUF5615 family PIN-like protein [Balneolales bacterium]